MFKYYLEKTPLKETLENVSNRMGLMTTGFVGKWDIKQYNDIGADINLVCNEASIIAARNDKKVVELNDFEKAIDRVIIGMKKCKRMNKIRK